MSTPSSSTIPTTPIWEVPDEEQTVEGLDEHGEPRPEYAAALGLVEAPLVGRAAAAAIDIALFVTIQVPYLILAFPLMRRRLSGAITWYGFFNHPDFILGLIISLVTLGLTIALVVGQLVLQGRFGFTLGKLAMGLRVVNVKTLEKPGFWRVALRTLTVWPLLVTVVGPFVVLASQLFDRDRNRGRGWHDRVGRTWMVDVREGLDPYDKKRMRIARKTVTSAPAPRAKSLPSLATGAEATQEYRPGARTSAGVLGVARPHHVADRVVVGLTGAEPEQAPLIEPAPATPITDPAPPPAQGPAPALPTAPTIAQDTRDLSGVRSPAPAPAAPAPAPNPPRIVFPGAPAAPSGAATPTAAPRHVAPRPLPQNADEGSGASHSFEAGVSLVFDTGDRLRLTSPIVVGRSPQSIHGAHPMAIADPSSSISKTHALLRPTASGLEVIDQASTNGTTITHDGQERQLTPGEVALAGPNDTIRFGGPIARVLGS